MFSLFSNRAVMVFCDIKKHVKDKPEPNYADYLSETGVLLKKACIPLYSSLLKK